MTNIDPVSACGAEGRVDLGPFRLLRKIGSGGMGAVFLAEDRRCTGANGLVALKRIHPHLLDDAQFVEMFFDEAEIASRIRHPNVARVLDFGTLSGAPFLTMEYLQGQGLAEVWRAIAAEDCPLDRQARLVLIGRVVADAAEGLHAAHELRDEEGEPMGVVHRDVSPQNIFVGYDGTSKVVDFGAAKADTQRHRTRTGFFKGKCAYIAPDTLMGKPIDRRSDIWSLGVVLWELLTRERLFMRDTAAQTLRAVLDAEIVHPTELADVPEALAEVAMKAVSREPSDRHQSALELAGELDAALAEVARVGVGKVTVARALDELFVGARAAAERETARLLDRADEPTCDEDLTMLWLDLDQSCCEKSSVTRVVGVDRPSPATLAATASSSPGGEASRGLDRWKMATGCLVAGLVGCLLGSSTGNAAAASVRDAEPAAVSAGVVVDASHGRAASSPAVQIWATDAEGRRQLLWSGSGGGSGYSAVTPVDLRPVVDHACARGSVDGGVPAAESEDEPEEERRSDAGRDGGDDGDGGGDGDERAELEESEESEGERERGVLYRPTEL